MFKPFFTVVLSNYFVAFLLKTPRKPLVLPDFVMLNRTLMLIKKLNTAHLLIITFTSWLKDSLLRESIFIWKTGFCVSWVVMFTLQRSEDSNYVHVTVGKERVSTQSYRNYPVLTVALSQWPRFGQTSDFSFYRKTISDLSSSKRWKLSNFRLKYLWGCTNMFPT